MTKSNEPYRQTLPGTYDAEKELPSAYPPTASKLPTFDLSRELYVSTPISAVRACRKSLQSYFPYTSAS